MSSRIRDSEITPAPPSTPSTNDEGFEGDLKREKWMKWERVQEGADENEGVFIIRDELQEENSDERKGTKRRKRRRTLTKKRCDRCGTWNHIRRVACSKCLANRDEMGKSMRRNG